VTSPMYPPPSTRRRLRAPQASWTSSELLPLCATFCKLTPTGGCWPCAGGCIPAGRRVDMWAYCPIRHLDGQLKFMLLQAVLPFGGCMSRLATRTTHAQCPSERAFCLSAVTAVRWPFWRLDQQNHNAALDALPHKMHTYAAGGVSGHPADLIFLRCSVW
jgi:hypothetical protein